MISWPWVLVAVFGGFGFGVFMMALLVAGANEHIYREGFTEGHTAGYQDGLKEFGKTG